MLGKGEVKSMDDYGSGTMVSSAVSTRSLWDLKGLGIGWGHPGMMSKSCKNNDQQAC